MGENNRPVRACGWRLLRRRRIKPSPMLNKWVTDRAPIEQPEPTDARSRPGAPKHPIIRKTASSLPPGNKQKPGRPRGEGARCTTTSHMRHSLAPPLNNPGARDARRPPTASPLTSPLAERALLLPLLACANHPRRLTRPQPQAAATSQPRLNEKQLTVTMERLLWASAPSSLVCGGKRGKGDDAAVVDPMGAVGQLGEWLCRAALAPPPPPRVCGTPGGPPVTARRVRLRDGRHLAYEESGVPRESARYRIVFSHGFTGSRLDSLRASQELAEELGVYMVGFDRAGYGESDPNPSRSVRSAALDMEELADALGLGDKFYAVGFSLGCHAVWGALKYIPHRLAGAAMLAPVVNYWWPGFPPDLSAAAYGRQARGDQWALRVSHHAPGILHWWMEQRWLPLPTSTVVDNTTHLPNKRDAEVRRTLTADGTLARKREMATQQGIHESYYRDMAVMFGKWEFDPMADLPEPPCPVHLWQGDEDGLVPVELQRHVAGRLGWVNYHELPGTGHFLSAVPGLGDTVLRTLFG